MIHGIFLNIAPLAEPISDESTRQARNAMIAAALFGNEEAYASNRLRFVTELQNEARSREAAQDRDLWFNFHLALAYIDAEQWESAQNAIVHAETVAYQLYQDEWETLSFNMEEFVRHQMQQNQP